MTTTPTSKPWIRTPLVESAALSKIAGCKVLLKLENLQPSGSFKLRGIGNYVQTRLTEQQQLRPESTSSVHFFCSSGGNAGLAAVYAARYLGFPCTVVVPMSTKPDMIKKLEKAGAQEVIQKGNTWRDADQYMRKECIGDKPQNIYVPPFNHKDIWKGASTMVHEMKAQIQDLTSRGSGRDSFQTEGDASKMPDKPVAIICSVGGGGLMNGVVEGLAPSGNSVEADWASVPILAVETVGAESLAQSLEKKERITLDTITSEATSLGAVQVCERTFELGMKGLDDGSVKSVVVTDEEAMEGCLALADEERLMVELSCGASAAPLFKGKLDHALGRKVQKDEAVIVIVCGGCNISPSMLERYRQRVQNLPNGH